MKKILALILAVVTCLAVFAGCGDKGKDGLQAAKEYLDTIMKAKSENTPADYDVLEKVMIGQKDVYTIEWSVNVTDNVKVVVAEDGKVTIDVNERSEADVAYVLTATIKNAKGKTIKTSYNRNLPAFKELSWSEFCAAADDSAVVIKGIITGIVNTDTKHELYLEDKDGGYYVYNLDASKMEGLAVGMEIRVSGIRDTYYGVNQVIEASVEILNSELAPVTPKDVTDIIKAASTLDDKSLHALQSTLVTIKDVVVLGQNAKDSTYYDFAIDGKISYVRISSSANMLSKEDTDAFQAAVAANKTMDANVTGLVSIYNNNIYLIPVSKDAFSDFHRVERTPEEQVEFEKGIMDSVGPITEGGTITLANTGKAYNTVNVTWALKEASDLVTLDGNKLTIAVLPDDATEIVLVATLTSGDKTATKEFTVKINAAPKEVADLVSTPATGTKYKFYIKQYNTKQTLYLSAFSNGTLEVTTDPTKALNVGIDAVEGKDGHYYFYYYVGEAKSYITLVVDGDKVSIAESRYTEGVTTFTYNSDFNMLVGTVSVKGANDSEAKEVSYWFGTYNKNNNKIGISATTYINSTNYNVSQFPAHFGTLINVDDKTDAEKVEREKNDLSIVTDYEVAGEVKLPLFGDLFSKVTISWAVDPADMSGAVVIEDGTLKVAPQSADASVKVTATIKHGSVTETKEFTVKVAKKVVDPISIEEALKLPDGSAVVVLGTVTEVGTWSDQYKNVNVTITDAAGKTLYLYRLGTDVKLGDIILVTGKMGTYNDARQLAQGGTADILVKAADIVTNEAANGLADGTAVVLKGTVTDADTWSDQYKNMSVTITDEAGKTFYVYRVGTKVEEGDIIVVTGKIGSYNGKKQVAQGSTAIIVGKSTVEKPSAQEVTVAEALEMADGTEVIITGTVSDASAWSDQYKNMNVTITDSTGSLYVYRLSTQVKNGDVIKVTGKMATYNDARQIAQGATAVIVTAA